MSPQYGELRPTNGWDPSGSLRHPCSVTAWHLVVGVSQTLRRGTEGATSVRQGDHHVGHWPTFYSAIFWNIRLYNAWLSVCTEGGGNKEGKELFRISIGGNENQLARRIDVESGLWRELLSRKVLTEEQLQSCQSEVFCSIIFVLWKLWLLWAFIPQLWIFANPQAKLSEFVL